VRLIFGARARSQLLAIQHYISQHNPSAAALALTPKDETVRLGFGADEKVKVARAPVRKTEGSTGLISTSKTDEREYKMTVRNGHDTVVQVMIEDQVPVSENAEVQVELLPVTTAPTQSDVADRRGILAWNFELAPGATREVRLAGGSNGRPIARLPSSRVNRDAFRAGRGPAALPEGEFSFIRKRVTASRRPGMAQSLKGPPWG
jgi:uncharacterized protein DUF4139